ncbi:MAG: peptidylprolyl isomerase [Coriobacteriia bacterium]|nr:peptidylprolyl isomerase [Coriobacteriia bacterium]
MERFSLKNLIAAGPARALKLGVAACGLVAVLALSGCAGSPAASMDGVSVSEDQVTEYIQKQREVIGVSSDEDWANYLAYIGQDAQALRKDVATYLLQRQVLEQQVNQHAVMVTNEDVTEAVNQEKSKFATGAEWEAYLKTSGITEEEFVQNKRYQLLCQHAIDAGLAKAESPSEADLAQMAGYYSMYYEGMPRTAQIQFKAGDEELAKQVLEQIKAGELTFDAAARTYSIAPSASQGGDEGWIAFDRASEEYQSAATTLKKGEVSDLVTDAGGIHIITVTDNYATPADTTSLSAFPEQFADALRTESVASARIEAVTAWLNPLIQEKAQVTDMPQGLPYDVAPAQLGVDGGTDAGEEGNLSEDGQEVELQADGEDGDAVSVEVGGPEDGEEVELTDEELAALLEDGDAEEA